MSPVSLFASNTKTVTLKQFLECSYHVVLNIKVITKTGHKKSELYISLVTGQKKKKNKVLVYNQKCITKGLKKCFAQTMTVFLLMSIKNLILIEQQLLNVAYLIFKASRRVMICAYIFNYYCCLSNEYSILNMNPKNEEVSEKGRM